MPTIAFFWFNDIALSFLLLYNESFCDCNEFRGLILESWNSFVFAEFSFYILLRLRAGTILRSLFIELLSVDISL